MSRWCAISKWYSNCGSSPCVCQRTNEQITWFCLSLSIAGLRQCTEFVGRSHQFSLRVNAINRYTNFTKFMCLYNLPAATAVVSSTSFNGEFVSMYISFWSWSLRRSASALCMMWYAIHCRNCQCICIKLKLELHTTHKTHSMPLKIKLNRIGIGNRSTWEWCVWWWCGVYDWPGIIYSAVIDEWNIYILASYFGHWARGRRHTLQ